MKDLLHEKKLEFSASLVRENINQRRSATYSERRLNLWRPLYIIPILILWEWMVENELIV
jgi:hypothetical protein